LQKSIRLKRVGYKVVARVDMPVPDVQAQFTIFLDKRRQGQKHKTKREKYIEEIEEEAAWRVKEFCKRVGGSLVSAGPRR
jgi:hypothetical protein